MEDNVGLRFEAENPERGQTRQQRESGSAGAVQIIGKTTPVSTLMGRRNELKSGEECGQE